jgi:site-specific recombinase XerC
LLFYFFYQTIFQFIAHCSGTFSECVESYPTTSFIHLKGNVSRTVDISDKLKKRLERFVKLYRKRAKANSALRVSERGDRIIYRSIYAKVKRIGEQAGIGKLHPHMLRHTYLTRLYNIEKDLRFVQDQAGHASPTTTAIYAKTNNKARRRQVQALDEEEF